jgi:hypothetical protein
MRTASPSPAIFWSVFDGAPPRQSNVNAAAICRRKFLSRRDA